MERRATTKLVRPTKNSAKSDRLSARSQNVANVRPNRSGNGKSSSRSHCSRTSFRTYCALAKPLFSYCAVSATSNPWLTLCSDNWPNSSDVMNPSPRESTLKIRA